MPPQNSTGKILFRSVNTDLALVNEKLLSVITARDGRIGQLAGKFIKQGGKRLRPALTLLVSQICGTKRDINIEHAVIVELIHTASLFHDDVIDNADLRRGASSVNVILGNQQAVLSGDYLYSLALSMALNCVDPIPEIVNGTVLDMTEGEIIQALNRNNMHLTRDDYFWIIERKTAVLMELACRMGAIICGSAEDIKRFSEYGKKIGLAYQLIDDLLDWVSDSDQLGKSNFNDLKEGRITLPVLMLNESLSSKELDRFQRLLLANSDQDISHELHAIKNKIIDNGIETEIRKIAGLLSEEAIDVIGQYPQSDARDELVALARNLINRSY